jgi:hypothetical protein
MQKRTNNTTNKKNTNNKKITPTPAPRPPTCASQRSPWLSGSFITSSITLPLRLAA